VRARLLGVCAEVAAGFQRAARNSGKGGGGVSDRAGRHLGPHWLDGTPVGPEELKEWLHEPLPNGRPKFLDMYIDCPKCGHIRYQKYLHFRSPNWWYYVRKFAYLYRAAWWEHLHRRCVQCEFDKKIGRM
jgi:hypothetical protein